MIVLGIDPGTAALGYGIVERTGGRLRDDRPRLPRHHAGPAAAASGCWPSTRLVDELIALHEPDARRASSGCSSRATPRRRSRSARRAASCCWPRPSTGAPVREATPNEVKSAIAGYGAADKEQVQRMVQLVLGHERAAATRRRRRRAGDRDLGRQHGRGAARSPRRGGRSTGAAVAPIERGETGYERAVREALAARAGRARAAKRSAS